MTEETTLPGSEENPSAEPATVENAETNTEETATAAETGSQAESDDKGKPASEPAADTQGADDEADKPKRQMTEREKAALDRAKAAEARAGYAERQLKRLERDLQSADAPAPRAEDFETLEEYQAELAAHKIEQRDKSRRQADLEDTRAEIEAARSEVSEAVEIAFAERAQDFRQRVHDYDAKIAEMVVPSDAVQREIIRSDQGPEIAYYLATHPAEARRLVRVEDATEVAREIGRLEGRVSIPTLRRTTQAPTPIQAEAKSGGTPPAFDPATASMDDYAEYWKKREGV